MATTRDPLIGHLLDRRYEVLDLIASGGMARVYRAQDMRLSRPVAVKVLLPGLGTDATAAARFIREAHSAARLTHPNIVAVYDQGTDKVPGIGEIAFIAMELVDGTTLRTVISERAPLPPAQALGLLDPVLAALGAAHSAGLMHRDVKPENVLIAKDGTVKVADFGLARAMSSATQHTSTGVLLGTVSYMAPEIVNDGVADARSDVYAAGIVLYEMLTGEKPHTGETPISVAYKHAAKDVPAPSDRVPSIPDYVDALVARATARNPSYRPADANVFGRQLRRVAQTLSAGMTEDHELADELTPPPSGDLGPSPIDTTRVMGTHVAGTPVGGMAPEPTAVLRPDLTDELSPRRTARKRTGSTTLASKPPAKPRRRGRLIALIAALVVIVLGATAGWWFALGRYDSMPSVLGLSPEAASAKLVADGYHVTQTDPSFSETVKSGLVMGSSPSPGGKILPHSNVTITVSKGIEEYSIPLLGGVATQDAIDQLKTLKMNVATPVEQWSLDVAAGTVIKTDPPAGTVERPGTEIMLYVSKGPKPVTVADWTGKDATAALKAIKAQHISVTTSEDFSTTIDKGNVISQSAKGQMHEGDSMTMVVSKGPPVVTMPNLTGEKLADAEAQLTELGLKYTTDMSYFFGANRVYKTNPSAGKQIPIGSTVTLSVV